MTTTALDIPAIREAARHHRPHILSSLGIDVPDSPKMHTPCPGCGGEDRFRFDDLDGKGTYFCNQATPKAGDGFDLIRHVKGCDFMTAAQLVSEALGALPSPRFIATATEVRDAATPVVTQSEPPDGEISQTLFRYTDDNGRPAFYVQRIQLSDGRKVFAQWGPTADAQGWQKNMVYAATPKPLYRLPHLLADPEAVIVLHEGEKAVHAHLRGCLPGLPTTSSGGAEKAKYTDFSPLAGRHVVICPDNDPPGERHARDVAERAQAAEAASVKILNLPGLPLKGDVVEWLEAGGTAEQFKTLVETAERLEASNSDVAATRVEPIPLDCPSLSSLPMDVLPSWFGDMVSAVSTATETPAELPALLGLAVLAARCQKSFVVQPEPGYFEPLNIWTVVALDSGNRKTAVMRAMTRPIIEWERQRAEAVDLKMRQIESDRETIRVRLQALRAQAAKSESFEDFEDKKAEIRRVEETLPPLPVIPRVWAQDITPEKLGQIMAEQEERMAILSDEGGLFDIMAGRYNGGIPNLDIFLQSHAGAPVRVDRGSRPPVVMQHPALTIGLSPQPEVLRGLADKPGFRGRGLLARFLYALPVSTLGSRTLNGRPVPDPVAQAYQAHLCALLEIELPADDKDLRRPYILKLSREAYSEWKAFGRTIEPEMREGGRFEQMKDWASKLPGAAIRLAGLLHCAEHAHGHPWAFEVSGSTMKQTLALAAVLSQHALAVFDLIGADAALEGARKVWRWIERHRLKTFTARDCFQALRGTFRRVGDIEPAFAVLLERQYIFGPERRVGPGRPSRSLTVNPVLSQSGQD